MDKVSIFNYCDYRCYLRDYYEWQKSVNAHFSYRYFMQKAGYNSSGLYSGIVNGQTALTEKLAEKFSSAIKHEFKEREYFKLMVRYQRAQSGESRQKVYEAMIALLPSRSKRLRKEQNLYYSKWYYAAIRESLSILDVGDDVKKLAEYLEPSLKTSEVKRIITTLNELGLIEKNSSGFWKAVDAALISGAEVGVHVIHGFQKEMMSRAQESLERFTKEERYVTSKTFSISQAGFDRVAQKIEAFQNEIRDIIRTDCNENAVFQLNVQMFPLTKKE